MTTPPTNNLTYLGRLLIGLTFLWIIGVAFATQLAGWIAPAVGSDNSTAAIILTLAEIVLIGVPLLPLAWLWRGTRQQAVFRAWLLAAGYILVLLPSRLLIPIQSQAVLLSQLLLSLLYLALGWFFMRRQAPGPRPPGGLTGLLLAAGAAAVMSYPWLLWGALGSLLDTLLALALGLVAGLNIGLIMSRTWLPALNQTPRSRGWDIFAGGLVIGAMLTIIASGLSFNSGQLRLMLALPGLGWLAMILAYPQPDSMPSAELLSPARAQLTWRPAALLVSLVAAVIITVMDTDALSLTAGDPLSSLTLRAAFITALLGWGLTVTAGLGYALWKRAIPVSLAASSAITLWLVGVIIYFGAGHPGFYGDRLFVVLKEQADVSAAVQMDDYQARRRFVYETLVTHANTTQADLRNFLRILGFGYRSYYLVNAIEVDGGLLARLVLATRLEVDRILPSPRLRPLDELPTDHGDLPAPTEPHWNLTNIGADRVWHELGVRGEGIVVGQSDSGVQWDHPELINGYRGRSGDHAYNWLDPWGHTPAPTDFSGHGSHTLGSVLGQNVGVAPAATWIACANLTRNVGNPALYLDCMQFMLAPYPPESDPFSDGDPTRGAHILNNSWGCPGDTEGCDPTVLQPAVRALRSAGIFVVASAGNDGPACGTVTDPIAIYDEVFSVGAVDERNELAPFSSAGPVTVDGSGRTKPDILAPGVQVLSAMPESSYAELSGTSMAGPHVAGVVALIWSANPKLIGDIDRTEQILIETAAPFSNGASLIGAMDSDELAENGLFDIAGGCVAATDTSQRPNNVAGYGLVNAYEAVKRALETQE